MTSPNVARAVDAHVLDAIDEKRAEADDLMQRLAETYRELSELEALRDLRVAQHAKLAATKAADSTSSISPLRSA